LPVPETKTALKLARNKVRLFLKQRLVNRYQKLQELRKRSQQLLERKQRLEPTMARSALQSQPSLREGTPMFFVVGLAKSGTSWLMRLLNNHPEILCRGEGKFFGKDSPRSLQGALARSEELQTWLSDNPWTSRDQDPDLQDLVSVLVHYLMQEKLKKTRKKIVGDKTPIPPFPALGEIATLCPGSKVVHIIRDGRDVAVSATHHRWNNATDKGGPFKLTPEQKAKRDAYHSNPGAFGFMGESIFEDGYLARAARIWSTTVERVSQDGFRLLNDNYYQLHYEDLLTDSLGETRRLLEFLGADSSEAFARKCIEGASFEKMAGRERGKEDPTSFYRKGISGDWQGVFTKEDRQVFKEEAGEMLIQLGYERDSNW
jgi:hypothetical protein